MNEESTRRRPDAPDLAFEQFLRTGRFMLQRSASSGSFVFYPRVAAPGSGANDLEWVQASGQGTVYATTVVRPKPPQAPYNVALIDLAEGPRMMSRVESVAPGAVVIGLRVQARIASDGPTPCVVFDPAPVGPQRQQGGEALTRPAA